MLKLPRTETIIMLSYQMELVPLVKKVDRHIFYCLKKCLLFTSADAKHKWIWPGVALYANEIGPIKSVNIYLCLTIGIYSLY